MIEIYDITKKYGNRTVLDISSLSFSKGETVVIAGPNGSGKSTLLKILAGTLKADSGKLTVGGKVLYLPQHSLPFGMTVRKNILFSIESRTDKEVRCDEILRKLNLKAFEGKNAKTLSGGECQRLALARLLVNDCDFLILDEPSSAADIEGNELIEGAVKEYKEKNGCGVIMTTHSPRQALDLADRIIMLCDGRVAENGSFREILQNPQTEWTKKFISQWSIDFNR